MHDDDVERRRFHLSALLLHQNAAGDNTNENREMANSFFFLHANRLYLSLWVSFGKQQQGQHYVYVEKCQEKVEKPSPAEKLIFFGVIFSRREIVIIINENTPQVLLKGG